MKFSLTVEGEQKLLGVLKAVDLNTQTEVRKAIRKSANRLKRGMRKRAPIGATGNLRKSVRVKYFDHGMRALIGPMFRSGRYYPLAHLIEYGTKPHTIKPETRKALKLTDGFAASVEHQGIPAQPYIGPAWEEERSKYLAEIKKALDVANRKAERRG